MMIIDPYRFNTGPSGPIPLANLVVHLKSDAGINIFGSGVNQWDGQSGTTITASQPIDARRPAYSVSNPDLNNLSSVNFNASLDHYMQLANPPQINLSANGWSIYAMVRVTSWPNIYSMLMAHTNGTVWTEGWGILYYNGQLRYFVNNWNNVANYVSLGIPTPNKRVLYKFSWDKTTIKASQRVDGVTTSGTKAYAGAYTHPSSWTPELMRGNTSTYDVNGQWGELLIYNAALSSQDDLQVENYLKTKWGLL